MPMHPQTGLRSIPGLQPMRPWLVRGFRMIARRRIRGAFRAVRIANEGALREAGIDPRTAPLVLYANHPSWWDPLLGFVLMEHLFGDRAFYAPMDADALTRYRILNHLGMFPVRMDSSRGAVQFLRTGDAVLEAGYVLGVTPQGRFTDVRERPVTLRPGLAALLEHRASQGRATAVVPLALEYTFWDQRLPEALALLGEPLWVRTGDVPSRDTLQASLTERLTEAQDRLSALSRQREPAPFAPLLEGTTGSAGFYSLWEDLQRLRGATNKSGDHTVHTKES